MAGDVPCIGPGPILRREGLLLKEVLGYNVPCANSDLSPTICSS